MSATADLIRVKEAASKMPQKALPSKAEWSRQVTALTSESNRAFLIALRILDKPALAEEAVQDAYARMLERPVEGLVDAQVRLYLFKTVRSVALNLSMASQSRKQREEKHAVGTQETQPSPADAAEKAEAIDAARAALNQLPLEEREAVSLCCEQDLTRHAAAEVLGVPERTLASRVERGLASLQRILAVQGFAGVSAVAVGQGLRDVGVPPAPAGLTEALSTLTSQAANLARTSVRASVRASVRTAKKTAAAGLTGKILAGSVMAIGAVGIYWLATQQPSSKPVPAPSVVPAPASAPKIENPLPVRWRFDKGPASELEVVEGTWAWEAPTGVLPGRMQAPQNKEVLFRVPTQIPARPFVVDMKLHFSAPSRQRSLGAFWDDGKQAIQHQTLWYYLERNIPYGPFACRYYFFGRYLVVVGNSRILGIGEHSKEYPSSRLRFRLHNFAVEEIEIRALAQQEIPAPLREIPKLLKELGPSRDEGSGAPPFLIPE